MGLMSVNVSDLFLNGLVVLASVSFSSSNVLKVTALFWGVGEVFYAYLN